MRPTQTPTTRKRRTKDSRVDILLLDALVPEAMAWLEARHKVEYRPEFADDMVSLRQAAYKTKGIIFPRQTIVTRDFLDFLPKLKAVGRLHVGTDNTDLEACKERDIKVIHASSANVRSNAEYLLSCLLIVVWCLRSWGADIPRPRWGANSVAAPWVFSAWHPRRTPLPAC